MENPQEEKIELNISLHPKCSDFIRLICIDFSRNTVGN